MKYTVVYLPAAEAQLIDFWIRATDRQAITEAANRLDREMGLHPLSRAKPIQELFALEDPPLAVLFHVDDGDCMVRVISVKLTAP